MFSRSVPSIFSCSRIIGRPTRGIYKSLTETHECRNSDCNRAVPSNFRYRVFAVGDAGRGEPGHIRCLAVSRADKLWASHKQQSHDLVEMTKEQSAQ
jgi:hypothetical protein